MMPDLLLEVFSEEIPARMQRQGARRFLVAGDRRAGRGQPPLRRRAGFRARRGASRCMSLACPRRSRAGSRSVRGRGSARLRARSRASSRARDLRASRTHKIETDPKKGQFYLAVIEQAGAHDQRGAEREILPAIVRGFPWPKSMRWGAGSTRPRRSAGCGRCTRSSARSVLRKRRRRSCPSPSTASAAADVTYGHRFPAPWAIQVRRFEDYVDKLAKAKVTLDADRRKQIILADAQSLALAQGLELVEDEGLLEEVAGLVEWPVALMGEFDSAFLDIPPEVIRATIRANQKCFVLRAGGPEPPAVAAIVRHPAA